MASQKNSSKHLGKNQYLPFQKTAVEGILPNSFYKATNTLIPTLIAKFRLKLKKVGKTIGEGNGNPLQYSCLENPMDGGAW